MSYRKNGIGDGRQYSSEEVIKEQLFFLPNIKDFIEKYKLVHGTHGVAYHMKVGHIDWMRPARDRFVLLTKTTMNFYEIQK